MQASQPSGVINQPWRQLWAVGEVITKSCDRFAGFKHFLALARPLSQ